MKNLPADPRVKYYDFPLTNGTATINRAIKEHAHGDIITVLHDDDHLTDENSIFARAKYLMDLEPSGLEFVYSSWRRMRPNGSVGDIVHAEPVNVSRIFSKEYIHCVTMMWRKSVHERIGYLNETLPIYSDYDWKVRCLMECSCLMVPAVTIDYREHSQQHSARTRGTEEHADNERRFRERIKELYGKLI